MKLLKFSLSVALFVLGFWILIAGQNVLLPFVIALVFWYLINLLAEGFGMLRLWQLEAPRWLCFGLSIFSFGLIVWALGMLISSNIDGVLEVAPTYQANLENRMEVVLAYFHVDEIPTFSQLMEMVNLRQMITVAASSLTGLATSSGVILIYIVFLLLEQGSFTNKISALFPNSDKEKSIRRLLARIKQDVRKYFGIKIFTSSLTGILSYIFLMIVGVDFAAFWAILIFLLNFIPTIGSIIATVFPSLITLVQFDTLTPFVIVVTGVTSIQIVVGNILEPRLMGNSLNLSPMVILLNLSLWGIIWGVPGMFLCVPFLVITMIVFSHLPQTRSIAVILSKNGQLTTDNETEVHKGAGSGVNKQVSAGRIVSGGQNL